MQGGQNPSSKAGKPTHKPVQHGLQKIVCKAARTAEGQGAREQTLLLSLVVQRLGILSLKPPYHPLGKPPVFAGVASVRSLRAALFGAEKQCPFEGLIWMTLFSRDRQRFGAYKKEGYPLGFQG